MNFGDALTALKAGDWVRRGGMPDRSWLCMNAERDTITIRDRTGQTESWEVSHTELLATDWKIASKTEVEDLEFAEDDAARRAKEEEARRVAAMEAEADAANAADRA